MKDNYNAIERVMRFIDRVLSKTETFLSVGTTITCGLLLLFGILNRVVFKIPLRWTEEASRLLLILMVFTSLPIVTRERAHLKLAFLSETVKNKKVVTVLNFLADVSLIIIFAFISVLFFRYAVDAQKFGIVSPSMGFEMWILYGFCSLTFLDTTIRAFMVVWDDFFSKKTLLPRGNDDFSTT